MARAAIRRMHKDGSMRHRKQGVVPPISALADQRQMSQSDTNCRPVRHPSCYFRWQNAQSRAERTSPIRRLWSLSKVVRGCSTDLRFDGGHCFENPSNVLSGDLVGFTAAISFSDA